MQLLRMLLRGLAYSEHGIFPDGQLTYYAVIDSDSVLVAVFARERCQVKAIKKDEDSCSVIKEKCIGCGLCVSTCPEDAISLVHKEPQDLIYPLANEDAWLEERGRQRGVDFSKYK